MIVIAFLAVLAAGLAYYVYKKQAKQLKGGEARSVAPKSVKTSSVRTAIPGPATSIAQTAVPAVTPAVDTPLVRPTSPGSGEKAPGSAEKAVNKEAALVGGSPSDGQTAIPQTSEAQREQIAGLPATTPDNGAPHMLSIIKDTAKSTGSKEGGSKEGGSKMSKTSSAESALTGGATLSPISPSTVAQREQALSAPAGVAPAGAPTLSLLKGPSSGSKEVTPTQDSKQSSPMLSLLKDKGSKETVGSAPPPVVSPSIGATREQLLSAPEGVAPGGAPTLSLLKGAPGGGSKEGLGQDSKQASPMLGLLKDAGSTGSKESVGGGGLSLLKDTSKSADKTKDGKKTKKPRSKKSKEQKSKKTKKSKSKSKAA